MPGDNPQARLAARLETPETLRSHCSLSARLENFMSTNVAQSTNVVNYPETRDVDNRSNDVYALDVTLADRIRKVLAETQIPQSELSTRIGKSHGFLSAFFKRATADPTTSLRAAEIRKIAEATGYSEGWLAHGDGSPQPEEHSNSGDHDVGQDADPVLRNLPGYDKLLRSAQTLAPEIPRKLWDYLGFTFF